MWLTARSVSKKELFMQVSKAEKLTGQLFCLQGNATANISTVELLDMHAHVNYSLWAQKYGHI